jgi:5-methylcytosine-specific restriction enzyme subunit McrC
MVALREDLRADVRSFPANAEERTIWLDADYRLRLRPVLSWWRGGRCVFVGDAKYKSTTSTGAALHPDVYQALAYAVALGLPRATLIYAAGAGDEILHRITALPKTVEVRVLDLSLKPEALLAQITRIAGEIRSQISKESRAA